ncbi:6-pyruvoyl tetrahydropterin synthase family protein [Anatilimnocola sp. NA78]|uniref:6-pyruvoyl trahydropterin synthase family protein n=1 Tax=Anatilimnocola sp. NA78 TaxID=3415683 RepID=UPI003CE5A4E2
MSETYRIRLDKEHHVFAAAHFITFAGDICERLHGHNYRVAVEIAGPLDDNSYVIDFIAARDELRAITDELDHRMILPDRHPLIKVVPDDKEVLVTFTPDARRWIFPLGDCLILPVPNTTAELLARWIGEQLRTRLAARLGWQVHWLQVEVDENHGQIGICELTST